jgi:hypothetical protein
MYIYIRDHIMAVMTLLYLDFNEIHYEIQLLMLDPILDVCKMFDRKRWAQ